jgi:PEGA domain
MLRQHSRSQLRGRMKKLITFMMLTAVLASAKVNRSTDPADYPLTANVTGVTTGNHYPVGARTDVMNGRGIDGGDQTVMTTQIDDTLYDLRGPKLELGHYRAKIADFCLFRDCKKVIIILADHKGKAKDFWYDIVAEKTNPKPVSQTAQSGKMTPELAAQLIQSGQASQLVVVSVPPGADIYVDGTKLGKTPFSILLMKKDLDRTVTLRLDGYKDFEQKLAPNGQPLQLIGNLQSDK